MNVTAAPGARALIRDEEWLVRPVDPSNDDGDLLVCDEVTDDTPNGPHQKSCRYQATYALANREAECRTAWALTAGAAPWS